MQLPPRKQEDALNDDLRRLNRALYFRHHLEHGSPKVRFQGMLECVARTDSALAFQDASNKLLHPTQQLTAIRSLKRRTHVLSVQIR